MTCQNLRLDKPTHLQRQILFFTTESLFPLIADALGCSRIRHIPRRYRNLVIVLIKDDQRLENDIIPRAIQINFNLVVPLTKDLVLLKEVLLSRRALTETMLINC